MAPNATHSEWIYRFVQNVLRKTHHRGTSLVLHSLIQEKPLGGADPGAHTRRSEQPVSHAQQAQLGFASWGDASRSSIFFSYNDTSPGTQNMVKWIKSMTDWKNPSPFSWSRRALSLDKERREVWKHIASTMFPPPPNSCSVRALPPPWERGAEYVPMWGTHFISLPPWFSSLLRCRQLLLGGSTCLNLARDPLFSACLHSCTDTFQRQTPFLGSRTRHSRVGLSQAHICFALGLFGETSVFHEGCVFCPSVVSLGELFNRCRVSSHLTAGRNSRVSSFSSWFIFTTIHEIDTWVGLLLSVLLRW